MTKEYIKWNKEIPIALQEILEKVTAEFAKIEAERLERQKDLDKIEVLKSEIKRLTEQFELVVEANKALGNKNAALNTVLVNVKNVLRDV